MKTKEQRRNEIIDQLAKAGSDISEGLGMIHDATKIIADARMRERDLIIKLKMVDVTDEPAQK